MDWYYFLTQGVGFLAMILSALSFQMKTKKQIIIMQCLTAIVFATHYFMLPDMKGIAAAVVNLIAIARNIVFFHNDKPFWNSRWWVAFFALVMAGGAIVSDFRPIAVFMGIAMIFNTLSIASEKPETVRKIILISSPFALVYNIVVMSWGGIANEILVECLTLFTFLRERKKSNEA